MIAIKIKLKNYNQIRSAFRKVPAKLTKNLNVAVEKVLLRVESQTKRNAPVNKQSGGGNLRQSIRSQMTGISSGKVEVGAKYAIFVHEGTKPHIIKIRRKKVLANKRQGKIFGKVVKHPGTRANPFLQEAVDKSQGFIDKEFEKAVNKAIK